MPTPTDIVNVALRRIGADRIGDLDSDTTETGRVARDLYDEARKDMLTLGTWNFATKRTSLDSTVAADIASTPTFGWDYAYIIPEDFLRMVSVHPTDDDASTIEYRLEFDSSQDRVLLCNATIVYLRYIFDLEDPNVMSSGFRDALAFRLAREFAGALGKSAAAAQLADTAYRRTLARAKAIEGVEDYPDTMAVGSWASTRFDDGDDI